MKVDRQFNKRVKMAARGKYWRTATNDECTPKDTTLKMSQNIQHSTLNAQHSTMYAVQRAGNPRP